MDSETMSEILPKMRSMADSSSTLLAFEGRSAVKRAST